MIVISQDLVLARGQRTTLGLNAPVFGWLNTAATVSAEGDAAGYPATNMLNTLTNSKWVAASADPQSLTFSLGTESEADFVALARHNLGSAGVEVTVKYPDPEDEEEFIVLHSAVLPASDQPLMIRFVPTYMDSIVIDLNPLDDVPPQIAVLFVGRLLEVPRGVPPGHTPITMGRQTEAQSDMSQGGDFLGSTIISETLRTSITFDLLDADWFRAEMAPFIAYASKRKPFFWAWAPQSRPSEIGYCWATRDPIPVMNEVMEDFSVTIDVEAIAI